MLKGNEAQRGCGFLPPNRKERIKMRLEPFGSKPLVSFGPGTQDSGHLCFRDFRATGKMGPKGEPAE